MEANANDQAIQHEFIHIFIDFGVKFEYPMAKPADCPEFANQIKENVSIYVSKLNAELPHRVLCLSEGLLTIYREMNPRADMLLPQNIQHPAILNFLIPEMYRLLLSQSIQKIIYFYWQKYGFLPKIGQIFKLDAPDTTFLSIIQQFIPTFDNTQDVLSWIFDSVRYIVTEIEILDPHLCRHPGGKIIFSLAIV